MDTQNLIFNPGSIVRFGGNDFIDVPIILQVDDVPIVEVINETEVTRTTRFSIFNNDGVQLAKVVGARLFLTADGGKSGLKLHHPDKMTVCELGGKVLFEIRRESAAAIALTAELYSPTGTFVKSPSVNEFGFFGKDGTQIGNSVFARNTLKGMRVGFSLKSDGSVAFGCR